MSREAVERRIVEFQEAIREPRARMKRQMTYSPRILERGFTR
ncbi:MAG: hypothetical protein ABIF88_03125 [archaeon]